MKIRAVIFDLDGVIVSTDEYHYQAWLRLAYEEGLPFDRETNELLRGVSRMESLDIILRTSNTVWSDDEKKQLAERKNGYYRELLAELSPTHILPGVLSLLEGLKSQGIQTAIGSSSKNAKTILTKIHLLDQFAVITDGTDIKNSKPDPEVFLLAAKRLGLKPAECLVVEDAEAGIDAAIAAGMKTIGVGSAAQYAKSNIALADLGSVDTQHIIHTILNEGDAHHD